MGETLMYTEVYEILNLLGDEYIKKIPNTLYQFIDENKSKNSNIKNEIHNLILKEKISDNAIEFISMLNLKYWASEKERNELLETYNKNEQIYISNANSLFQNNLIEPDLKADNLQKELYPSIPDTNNIFIKLINLIKKFLHK